MVLLEPVPRIRRFGAFARAGIVVAIALGLDQLTKHTIATGIDPGTQEKFLPGINFVHVRNKGVAFGVFGGGGPLVLAVTLVALLALIAYLAMRPDRPWLWLPTGLLIGGALGNLIDRLAGGEVIDFIKFPLWPAFNVADIAITFGVLALLWVLEGPREKHGR
ncbi:MAG: signal peptidase II [Solirubrobacterales bacterium]|nr:signal peptidase II [Solirubrobacterales bacterium]